MILGGVTPEREAVITLRIQASDGTEWEIRAVIDTGFNDYLTLPPALVAELNLPFTAPGRATLADGSTISLNCHRVTVVWGDVLREVIALATDGGPLVGMSML
jgi:clan AA aspartic protease